MHGKLIINRTVGTVNLAYGHIFNDHDDFSTRIPVIRRDLRRKAISWTRERYPDGASPSLSPAKYGFRLVMSRARDGRIAAQRSQLVTYVSSAACARSVPGDCPASQCRGQDSRTANRNQADLT
jgi:hypothetical protein